MVTAEFTDTGAETTEEVVTPAPETVEQTTQSDAANQIADAAEQEVSTFLQSKEGAKDGTEADEELPEIKAAREATEKATAERVERETKARLAKEEKDAADRKAAADRQKAFEDGYRQRMESVKSVEDELINLGVTPAEARRITNRLANDFNSHHADGLKLHEPTAKAEASAALSQALNDGFKSALGDKAERFFGSEEEPKAYPTVEAALESYREIVTDGLLSKTEADAATKVAVLAYHREYLEKDGGKKALEYIRSRNSGQVVNGEGSGGSYSFTTEHELNAAYNDEAHPIHNDHAGYAREYKRLTGREP